MHYYVSLITGALGITIGAGLTALWYRRVISDLSYDPGFGVLTARAGARDVVFFDLDHLHDLNTVFGYDAVNRMVRRAVTAHRMSDVLVSLRFSGDEFFAVVPVGSGLGFAERLRRALRHQDPRLSATFAVVQNAPDAEHAVTRAQAHVQQLKQAGLRGVIEIVP